MTPQVPEEQPGLDKEKEWVSPFSGMTMSGLSYEGMATFGSKIPAAPYQATPPEQLQKNPFPGFLELGRSVLRRQSSIESTIKLPVDYYKYSQAGGSVPFGSFPYMQVGAMMNSMTEGGESFEDFKRLTPESTQGIREEDWPKLLTNTQAQQKIVIENLKQAYRDQEIVDQSGPLGQVMDFGGAAVGLEWIVPPLTITKFATKPIGLGINAVRAAGYGAGIGSVTNAIHVATHEALTSQDWAERTIIDATLSGVFGGIAGAWKSGRPSIAEGFMEASLNDLKVTPLIDEAGKVKIKVDPPEGDYGFGATPSSLSSAMNTRVSSAQTKFDYGMQGVYESEGGNIFQNAIGSGFDYALGGKGPISFLHSPEVTALRSPYGTVRQMSAYLMNRTPQTRLEAQFAKFKSAESILKDMDASRVGAQLDVFSFHQDYFKKTSASQVDPINEIMFRERVGIALRNLDKDPDIAEVGAAAVEVRKRVIDPISQGLVEIGEMDARTATQTADSYFMRVYNRDVMRANEREFVQEISSYYKDINSQLSQYAHLNKQQIDQLLASGQIPRELLTSSRKLRAFKNPLDIDYEDHFIDNAKATFNTIMQQNDDMVSSDLFDIFSGRGGISMTKERTLLIPDNRIQKFLMNDVNYVLDVTTRVASRKIALHKMLMQTAMDNGSSASEARELIKDGKDYFVNRLQKEYDEKKALIETKFASNDKKRVKALAKEEKQYKKANGFIDDSVDMFMGTYGKPMTENGRNFKEYIQMEKDLNATLKLTDMIFSMAPEFIAPMYRAGLYNHFSNLLPVLGQLKELANKSSKARKELADGYIAMHTFNNSRAKSLTDSMDQYAPISTTGRFLKAVNNLTSKYSGVNHAGDFQEMWAAQTFTGTTIRTLKKWAAGKKIRQVEIERLRLAGIDLNRDGKMLMDEIGVHAKLLWGSYIDNVSQWKNPKAINLWNFAKNNEVRGTISQPGIFTRPYYASTTPGSAMFQMTGWLYGAQNNFLIPLIQGKFLSESTLRRMHGVIWMSAIGYMMNDVKRLANGKDLEQDEEIRFRRAFENSGLGGPQYDTYKKAQSVLGLLDGAPKKSVAEAAFGVGGSGLDEAQKAMRMLFPDMIGDFAIPWNEQGIHSWLKMLPLAESGLFKRLTVEGVRQFDLPQTPSKAKQNNSSGRR